MVMNKFERLFYSKKTSEVILTTQLNTVFNFQHSVKSVLEVTHTEFLIGNKLLFSVVMAKF